MSDGELLSECHDNPVWGGGGGGREGGRFQKYKATTTEAVNLSKAHHLMITEQ